MWTNISRSSSSDDNEDENENNNKRTMKKILFALVGVATMMLTSCFEDIGSSYTSTFARVVTIDTTSTPIKLIADCTGEVFKGISNLQHVEDLEQFGLSDVDRAEVYMQLDVDASYKQTLTMLQANKIDILAVTNTEITDAQRPFLTWHEKHLGGGYTPAAWVSGSYLNVVPVIPAGKPGKYFLTADHVKGDTLYFKLSASYNEDKSKKLLDYLQCFDLRTLRDTANAAPEQRAKMREVLTAMDAHRKDSMRIALTGEFIEYNFNYQGKDTIVTDGYLTNYFKYNF